MICASHLNQKLSRHETKRAGGGVVLVCPAKDPNRNAQHENATRVSVAKRLAVLKGYDFGGEYDAAIADWRRRYFVPADTLVGIEATRKLGILDEENFFGGLVPYPFMATKTITHRLVNSSATAPEGWTENFASRVQSVVLLGFATFTLEDARLACARVLQSGDARLKPALCVGGQGQQVISTLNELDRALDCIDPMDLSTHGLSIEENLQNVTTYSVGTVRLEEMRIAYCGTQRVTRDHHHKSVYGGSDLLVVPGDFDDLLKLNLASEFRAAVKKARVYDVAASTEIPGLIASRRNYDVAFGEDCHGRRRGGVLEQSWRIGGASPAEVAALEAFREDPSLIRVRASCAEIYDARHEPPPHAQISFSGEDTDSGALIKYSVVERYADTR
ncbi:MAG TPA: DUF3182 family protein [Candidatus Binatia bacterium]|nr:DUF3182 family protein [Candidatus Binatia bacterium]